MNQILKVVKQGEVSQIDSPNGESHEYKGVFYQDIVVVDIVKLK